VFFDFWQAGGSAGENRRPSVDIEDDMTVINTMEPSVVRYETAGALPGVPSATGDTTPLR